MSDTSIPRQVRLLRCTISTPMMEERATDPAAKAKLKNYGYDIRSYVQSLEIFENIFENTVSGSLLLLDGVGLIEYLPIVGVETVHIIFDVDDVDERGRPATRKFARAFRVVKVSDVSYPQHNFRLYTLELATHEFVRSVSSRICRAFKGMTCEQAVTDILNKDLRVGETGTKIFTPEPTVGTLDVTIPNYTPLQAINYFTMLALSRGRKGLESNFLFFETLEGFHFTSVRKLIEDGLPHVDIYGKQVTPKKFEVNPGAISNAKKVDDQVVRNSLIRVHQDQTFDLLMDIVGGTLRSKMIPFDFVARKIGHEEDSRYTKTFKDTTHLAEFPVYPINTETTVSKNTRIFTFPSNMWTKNSSYVKGIEEPIEQRMWEALVLRNRQLRELQHLQTLIDIPGHPDLRAGAVIDVRYPSSSELQRANKPTTVPVQQEATPYYSGPHLVTAVRHHLAIQTGGSFEYRMHCRVCRDSLSSPLLGYADEAAT